MLGLFSRMSSDAWPTRTADGGLASVAWAFDTGALILEADPNGLDSRLGRRCALATVRPRPTSLGPECRAPLGRKNAILPDIQCPGS